MFDAVDQGLTPSTKSVAPHLSLEMWGRFIRGAASCCDGHIGLSFAVVMKNVHFVFSPFTVPPIR